MIKTKVLLVSLVFTIISCTTGKPKPEPIEAKKVEQVTKLSLLLKGKRRDQAEKSLEKLAVQNSDNTVGHLAHEALADHFYQSGKFDQALKQYSAILSSRVEAENEVNARLGAGRTLLQLRKFHEAIAMVERNIGRDSHRQSLVETHKILAVAHQNIGNRLPTLRSYVYLSLNSVELADKEAFRLKAFDIVEARLNDEEVKEVATESQYEFLRGAALFRIGSSYFDLGNYGEASSYLSSAIDYLKEGQLYEKAKEMRDQIESRGKTDRDVIGAVLPLTGKNSRMGLRALRGLQLGIGVFGQNRTLYKLSVVDSEGNAEISRRAFKNMVINDNPIVAVGSLLSKTALPIATKAQELGVPTIGLSQKSGITDVGDLIFRNAITSELQVSKIVDHLMSTKKMNRFAILYPNDSYGIEFANLFWDEVLARGGHITGAQTYDPKETDFRGPIRRLVGTYFLEGRTNEYNFRLQAWRAKQRNKNLRDLPKDILPPIIDFDALFIPDEVRALSQIAPMLAYNDVEKVALVGTNLWNLGGLVEKSGRFVENSVFVDAPINDPKNVWVQDFQKTFGYPPGSIELQAFDTGLIIRHILDSGVSTREEMKARLAGLTLFMGANGKLSMSSRREVLRPITLLTVQGSEIKALE